MIKCDKGLITAMCDSVPQMATELELLISHIYKEIVHINDEDMAIFMMVGIAYTFCKDQQITLHQIWKAIEVLQNYEEDKYAAN